jgi:hypothetical protein
MLSLPKAEPTQGEIEWPGKYAGYAMITRFLVSPCQEKLRRGAEKLSMTCRVLHIAATAILRKKVSIMQPDFCN